MAWMRLRDDTVEQYEIDLCTGTGAGKASLILCNAVVAGKVFRSLRKLADCLRVSHVVSRSVSRAYSMRLMRELEIPDSEAEAKKVTEYMFKAAPRLIKVLLPQPRYSQVAL